MADAIRAYVVLPGEVAPIPGPVGGPTVIKARTEQTAGSVAVIEIVIPPKQGPPLHVHAREDELSFVLEGDFRFRADEEMLLGPQGSFVFVPRGTRHCFQNIGDTAGRLIIILSRPGWNASSSSTLRSGGRPVDPAVFAEVARTNWMEVAGPPLGESNPL